MDGQNSKTIYARESSEGVYIPINIWRKITPLTADTLILVLANKLYKDCKKISNYKEFISYSKNFTGTP